MAKKEMTAVPEIIDNVEALEKKMAAMREAQWITFSISCIGYIFPSCAAKGAIPIHGSVDRKSVV